MDFENRRLLTGHHRDKQMRHRLLQIEASYGVTDRFTVLASLPVVNDKRHEQYELLLPGTTVPGHDTHGPAGAVVSAFTTEHEAGGIGDVQLGGGYAFLADPVQSLVGRAVVELPTGSHRRSNARGLIHRPDLQPGSGSTDFVLTLQYQRRVSAGGLAWFTAGYYRHNTSNRLLYRYGNEASLSTGITQKVGRRIQWSLLVSGRRTAGDEYLVQPVPG